MEYILLFFSTIFQLSLTVVSLMFVIFSSAAISNGNTLSKLQGFIFLVSMVFIPVCSLITACTLVYFFLTKSPYFSYWWHLAPLIMLVIYILYAHRFEE